MSQLRYRIQSVSQMTGIPAATLRAWERRYGFPEPERTASSYRLYSEHDIELIKRLKGMCERGLSPSEAVKVIKARVSEDRHTAGNSALQVSHPQDSESILSQTRDHHAQNTRFERKFMASSHEEVPEDPHEFLKIREQLLSAIHQFNPLLLERGVRRAMLLGSAKKVFDGIFAPVMHQIGVEWHQGILSIAQEHLVTETIGNATRDLLRIVQPDSDAKQIILACVSGELHAIPLYGSALHFVQWGYRVVILGVNTPPEALEQSVAQIKPAAIGLSVTYSPDLEKTRSLIPAYAQACQGRPLIVGGASAHLLQTDVEHVGGIVAMGSPLSIRERLEALL